jgi:hypothetical protein
MKKIIALALVLVLCVGLLAGCGGGKKEGGVIKIGYVNPYTGALAGNGEGCDWVVNEIETYVNTTLGGIDIGGAKYTVDVITYDSKSDQNTCGEMAAKLCDEDEVDMIIAIQTPETVIPVMNTAEAYGVPCIAIQAPVNPVAGNLAGSGAVARMFQRQAHFVITGEWADEDKLMEITLDAGADDIQVEDGVAEIWAAPENFEALAKAFEENQVPTEEAGIVRKPDLMVEITDAAVARQVIRLVERMEELDDVQQVTANYELSDAVAEELAAEE